MLSFLIILIFIYCCYVGYRRGVIYEGLVGIGYVISLLIAALLYKPVSKLINLWVPYPSANDKSTFAFFDKTTGLTLDQSFYAAVSFVIVLLVVFCIWRLILSGFNSLKYIDINASINAWGGILISLIVTQISLYLLLFILATVAEPGIQHSLGKSILANSNLRFSPGISHLFINLFVTSV